MTTPPTEQELIDAARVVATGASQAIDWVTDPVNAGTIAERRSVIEHDLRRGLFRAKRLIDAASQRMAVAVFGPSQVGKSHLISVLARKGDAMKVAFPGVAEPLDYIRQINPDRGKEATGLVSRFTLTERPSPRAGFPVSLRLLRPADIIKILANSYFFEGNPGRYGESPAADVIADHIEEFRAAAAGNADGSYGLLAEDVWDIAEYLNQNIPESDLTKKMSRSWPAMAEIAGRLKAEQGSKLWSILWGRHDKLTGLFRMLLEAHAKLDFASEVFVPTEAIDLTAINAMAKTTRSILDVESLLELGAPDASQIDVCGTDGRAVPLPRPVIATLTAEVRFRLAEKPWDFLDDVDLLDFPGYRARGLQAPPEVEGAADAGLRGLAWHFEHNAGETLKEMILRGKVDYLFQRYVADQDITAMLLCIKESNMDVKKLADVVPQWIASTHGARPQDRVGKPTLLFFVFTRFDMHFERKTSDRLDERFEGRMKASLTEAFGKSPESWVQKWTPNTPFTNCFLMRNPNILNRDIFAFADGRETGIAPESAGHVARLREAFISVDLVRKHFPDSGQSFDEMMRLNDGGATWIASHLAPVCRADVKPMQVRDRIEEVRRQVVNAIRPFYVPSDATARVAARQEVGRQVIVELRRQPMQHGRFGLFLNGLLIDPGDLLDRLYEMLIRRPGAQDSKPATDAPAALVASGPEEDPPFPWEELARGTAAAPRPHPEPAAVRDYNPAASLVSRSDPVLLVRTAMSIWFEHLYRRASDELFARDALVSSSTVHEIVGEISTAAIRLRLADRVILPEIEELKFVDRLDERLAKASIILQHRFNQFVMHLGYGLKDESERPAINWKEGRSPVFASRPDNWSVDNLPARPRPFRTHYVTDWEHALYQLFADNARGEAGLGKNIAQNEKLGRILASIGANEA
jgi:hypothetical protein